MSATTTKVQINSAYKHLSEYAARYEIVYGGAGSGKSYAVAQHIVLGALTYPGRKYLCVRKVGRTLRDSVFSVLRSIIGDMGLSPYFQINKQDMTITCVTGAQIMLRGLDDVEKLKSIHGVTDIWIEEASEINENDLTQLNLRLRGGTERKRMVLTFNPISRMHWLKRAFFDNEVENARVVHTTYHDNAFLDEDYRRELENLRNVDSYFYQVYALGRWGQLGNTVFSNYVVENFPYGADDLENVAGGIDFGYNNPSAVVLAGFKDGELYVFRELYRSGLTNTELIEQAKDFDSEYADRHYTADSAEPDRIEEFQRNGFRVTPAKKGKDSVRHGIDFLKRYRIHIHPSCSNIAKEIQAYKWREDKDGNVLDEPVDFNNHAIDALRYAVEHLWAQSDWRPIW